MAKKKTKLKWKDAGYGQIITTGVRGDNGFTINAGKPNSLYNHKSDNPIGYFEKLKDAKACVQLIHNG